MPPFPNLETKRFVLRPLEQGDVDAVLSFYSDPQTAWFTGREPFTRLAQAEQKVGYDLDLIRAGTGFVWAVTRPGNPAHAIGIACLFQWSRPNQHIELGYVLGRSEWGKGVMSEVVPAVIRYGFEALDVHRIDAHVDARNVASIRLLERCGFVHEGTRRERSRDALGQFGDLLCFGLLEREWRERG